METSEQLDQEMLNEELPENSSELPSENNVTTQPIEKEEPKVEVTPDSSDQKLANQTQCDIETPIMTSCDTDALPESDTAVKAETKMDVEPGANDTAESNSEPNSEPSVSQDPPVQPTDAIVSPKSNNKKSRARGNSESPHTPTPDKIARLTPRATRSSQNPDFAAKQRKFLNRVHDSIRNNSDSDNSQGTPVVLKGSKEHRSRADKRRSEKESSPKRPADSDDEEEEGSFNKKKRREPTKVVGGVDSYCWRCHRDGVVIHCDCAPCPRVYHVKCVQLDKPPDHPWMCPECSLVTQAEDTDKRSRAMRMLTLDQLCTLLRFALNRMKSHESAKDFMKPVDLVQFPYYLDYIVKPMDLSQLERNLKARMYGSTEAFLADAKWIVHNSIVFNSVQSLFTNAARALLKLCRQEMQHIENCPDCYQNSHTRSSDSWFTEACRRPHILVWAKLKGFPFWPAKVMSVNSDNNQVDVRFFGAHDRAWIPLNQCYLYSKLSPTPTTNNKNKRTLDECLQELEYHIKRLRDKFGQFEYAPYKTPYDPKIEDAQLLMMLPQYETKILGKRSRLSLHHDGARKSLGRRPISPKHSSPEKLKLEETLTTPVDSTTPNCAVAAEATDEDTGTMVSIENKLRGSRSAGSDSPVTSTPTKASPSSQGESEAEQTPMNKQDGAPILKKKTPLTAAAKKCFSTDKICAKCNSRTMTVDEENLCSTCSKLDKPSVDFKKDERSSDPNSTVRGTVTVQRKLAVLGESDQPDKGTKELASFVENLSDTGKTGIDQKEDESEVVSSEIDTAANTGVGPVESPPKFVIHKGLDSDTPDPLMKATIADKLQEKLCCKDTKAQNDHITREEVMPVEQEKDVDSSPEKVTSDATVPQETAEPVVVLHDLKNSKEMMDKIQNSDVNTTVEKSKVIVDTHSLSEAGSEVETDVSSSGDSDSVVVQESRKRKKKTINNVVQNLKERKTSVDERNDSKNTNKKDSNSVMLDESVEEPPILIIDEGESSDSKKSSSGKHDKSRRKGTPAKVYSRSSTSTESSETENSLTKSRSVEVLDEASGHFRRSSGENDRPVTITVVTDGDKPQKKSGKEIRSVNISKSLSLSVIKDSGGLEMECLDSDTDDQLVVDSAKKIQPRPTARKTLPNTPCPPTLTSMEKRPSSVPPSGTQVPPPLVCLRAPPRTLPHPSPQPRSVFKPSPLAELGPAHAKLDEVVQKAVTFMRSTFEEWLKVSTEGNSDNAEGLRHAHQLEIERLKWIHKQEMAELKHNTDLAIHEIRSSFEADKQRAFLDFKHKVEIEKEQAIQDTKKKQWCAYCQKEAQLYCCWNTAYCSYNCQQDHWVPHMKNCRNNMKAGGLDEAAPPPQPAGILPAYPQQEQWGSQINGSRNKMQGQGLEEVVPLPQPAVIPVYPQVG